MSTGRSSGRRGRGNGRRNGNDDGSDDNSRATLDGRGLTQTVQDLSAGLSPDKVAMMHRMVAMMSAPVNESTRAQAEQLMKDAERMGLGPPMVRCVRVCTSVCVQ